MAFSIKTGIAECFLNRLSFISTAASTMKLCGSFHVTMFIVKYADDEGRTLYIVSKDIAHLDTNALVRALDKGEVAAIDSALAGRTPIVSITAAKEYLEKGDVNILRSFLQKRGGSIGRAATQ